MIAPLKEPDSRPRASETLRRARRLVAETLFEQAASTEDVPRVSPWLAWSFAGWVMTVLVCYLACQVFKVW